MDKKKEDPKPISESGPVPRGLSQSTLSERDRRLEIARQRKEEFLRKRKAAASTTPTAASRAPAGHFGSQIHPPTQTPQGVRKRPMDFIEPTPPQSATSLVTPEVSHLYMLGIVSNFSFHCIKSLLISELLSFLILVN